MRDASWLILATALIAVAFAIPVGADDIAPAGTSYSITNPAPKEPTFCDAWQKTTSDANVSATIVKCDAESRTLVIEAKMRTNPNATLTTKDAKAKVESKAALKSLDAGKCTAAKAADCTDLAKAGDNYANVSPTYSDGAYVLDDKLTENDLPKTYKLTFNKDDKLDGVAIKFGAATETWVYTITGDTGTGYYIWETEPKYWHPANVTAANNFGGTGAPPDDPPNYVGALLYFNTSHAANETIVMETEFISTTADNIKYTTCVLMMAHTPIIRQPWDFSGDSGDNIRMCYYDNNAGTLYMATQNGAESSKTASVDATVSHIYKFRRNDTAVAFWVDGVQVGEITTNLPDDTMYAGMGQGNARVAVSPRGYWSNVSVDDGTSPPPVPTFSILFKDLAASFPATYEPTTGVSLSGTINATDGISSVIFVADGQNFTGTNTTYSGNLTWTNWTVSLPPFAAGTHNFTIYANDTSGNSNTSESFEFNISKASPGLSLTSSNGWLIVDGATTTLSCSGIGVGLYFDYSSVTNPYPYTASGTTHDVTCNVTATENYTADSDSQTLTIAPAGLAMTVRDESTQTPIVFNVTLANSTFSYTMDNIPNFFMAYSNASLPKGSMTATVSSTGYGTRSYALTVSPAIYQNVSAWLLPSGSGNFIHFHAVTPTYVGVPGVYVTANRTIGSTEVTVESGLSDGTGGVTFFLDPLITYKITGSKVLYQTATESITPTASDFFIFMIPLGTNVNVTTQFSNIYWNITPACGNVINTTTNFQFYITNTNNSLIAYGLNISLNGTTYSANGTTPSGGYVNITLDLTNYTNFDMLNITYWFNETGYPFYSHTYSCNVWNTQYSNSTLFGQLKSIGMMFCPVPHAGAIPWCPPLNTIALLVMIAVGAIGTSKFGVNGGGLASMVVLWIFVSITWFPWAPAFLMSLGTVGIIILKGGI